MVASVLRLASMTTPSLASMALVLPSDQRARG
jgi:hypothetical protein